MTTNQTIDGVPRELLERVATEANHMLGFTSAANYDECRAAVDELRALLDAPAPRQNFKKIEMAHVFNALEDVLGKPVLTSNQCHDLARALNDRLLSPLQLLSLPPEYAAAAQPQGETPDDDKSHPRFIAGYTAGLYDHKLGQPQGEPVAYRCRHSANEPWFFSDKPGYWEWQALYTERTEEQ